ncbi:MAG: glycosyltransferase family 39 protein [Myxococcales bacterium]|nr:glycosyltransferase family 39 protein [Myxococcales bacterium]
MTGGPPGAPPAQAPRRFEDTAVVAAVALVARLAFVVWAWNRIGPVADGTYYDTIARRLASGFGYTWQWPDGTVTPAAHYPVGYPALVAFAYRIGGAHPGVAMVPGALLGALGAAALHRAVAGRTTRRTALAVGLAFALHPALLSYTPALMTEGITASLLAIALYLGARASERGLGRAALFGVVIGLVTYVRPQNIVFAPVFPLAGFLTASWSKARLGRALVAAGVATVVAFAVLAPWTARNCSSMGRCALVSVNGGWNLLIGTDPDAGGSWAPIKVPEPCREVWDEAAKDTCFGDAARRTIREHPLAWAALAPQKLAVTFEYFGAGPWYLHAANPAAFGDGAKTVWGALETLVQRLLLAAGLVKIIRLLEPAVRRVPGRWGRLWAPLAAVALCLSGTLAVLALAALALVASVHPQTRRLVAADVPAAAALILLTAGIHAAFFGAGRYGLVVIPAVIALFCPRARDDAPGF